MGGFVPYIGILLKNVYVHVYAVVVIFFIDVLSYI